MRVPAVVEDPLVAVSQFPEHILRGVHGTVFEIEAKRLKCFSVLGAMVKAVHILKILSNGNDGYWTLVQ